MGVFQKTKIDETNNYQRENLGNNTSHFSNFGFNVTQYHKPAMMQSLLHFRMKTTVKFSVEAEFRITTGLRPEKHINNTSHFSRFGSQANCLPRDNDDAICLASPNTNGFRSLTLFDRATKNQNPVPPGKTTKRTRTKTTPQYHESEPA